MRDRTVRAFSAGCLNYFGGTGNIAQCEVVRIVPFGNRLTEQTAAGLLTTCQGVTCERSIHAAAPLGRMTRTRPSTNVGGLSTISVDNAIPTDAAPGEGAAYSVTGGGIDPWPFHTFLSPMHW
jgi:hypothetical protein